ncbi:RNA-binding protein 12 [Taenia crassiceps]|uniref:RNA-binding protein 12 n=1 Tax=Taenia crassiceps TaxID=6207 RepID=A0ABR4QBD8_9CEST
MTSVIIRLQNLPMTANASNIRRFFGGLNIPEGGVHIVGGEKGDAFIAFATDEDARKAMLLDHQYINSAQIRLFLSSKAEMQSVIDTARCSVIMASQQTPAVQETAARLPDQYNPSPYTILAPPQS